MWNTKKKLSLYGIFHVSRLRRLQPTAYISYENKFATKRNFLLRPWRNKPCKWLRRIISLNVRINRNWSLFLSFGPSSFCEEQNQNFSERKVCKSGKFSIEVKIKEMRTIVLQKNEFQQNFISPTFGLPGIPSVLGSQKNMLQQIYSHWKIGKFGRAKTMMMRKTANWKRINSLSFQVTFLTDE